MFKNIMIAIVMLVSFVEQAKAVTLGNTLRCVASNVRRVIGVNKAKVAAASLVATGAASMSNSYKKFGEDDGSESYVPLYTVGEPFRREDHLRFYTANSVKPLADTLYVIPQGSISITYSGGSGVGPTSGRSRLEYTTFICCRLTKSMQSLFLNTSSRLHTAPSLEV